MSAAVLPAPTSASDPDLAIKNVLRDTWRLYKRLFMRSVALGFIVFGGVELVRVVMDRTPSISAGVAALGGAALSLAGTSLVQGALADSVRDVHLGAEPAGIRGSYERAAARLGSLVGVSLLSAIGAAIGFLFLIVPGFMLMTRWAVAVPVVMYEGATPRDALGRSRQLVAGHGWAVFTVLFNAVVRVVVTGIVIGVAVSYQGSFVAIWVGTTVGAALTTPYMAHTLSVLYYRLTEPGRPLIPEPGQRWGSVWTAQDGVEPAQPSTTEPRAETLDEEQMRKFEERERQWGG